MAHRVLNGVNQYATGTGSGALTLGLVTANIYQTMAAAGIADGDTTYVRIQHETLLAQWEIVLVTYSAGAITRTFDSKSDSPTGALISFSAGNKIVSSVITADQVVVHDNNDNVAIRGALDVATTDLTSENLLTSYVVSNLAALKALTSRPQAVIVLTGKAAGLWGWNVGSTTTADDALVVQCTSGTAGRYKRAVYGGVVDPDWWGAVGDGATNDAAAIQAALDSGYYLVKLRPGASFAVSSTITVASGMTLDGQSFLPGNPKLGTQIIGSATLSPVVRVGTISQNGTASLRNITVSRVAGTPSASYIGIQCYDSYNNQFANVCSDNHGINWNIIAHATIGAGLGVNLINCHSTRSVDAHCEIDGYPEVYWIGGRFGQNGTGDYNGGCFVRFKGGVTGTAGGPNGIKFTSVQFNQGSNRPNYFLDFVNLAAPYPGVAATIFNFAQCHVEGVDTATVHSDSSWNSIDNLTFSQCYFNDPTVPFFALDAGTAVYNWDFIGSEFVCSTFNISSTAQINGLRIFGGWIYGTMAINPGGTGSTVSMFGVNHSGNAVFTGTYGGLTIVGDMYYAGALNATAALGSVFYDGAFYTQRKYARLTGTADGSGNLSVAHGIASGVLITFAVSAAYKTAGTVWVPMTVNFLDGANVSVSGGAPAASRPVQIYVEYSDTIHSGW